MQGEVLLFLGVHRRFWVEFLGFRVCGFYTVGPYRSHGHRFLRNSAPLGFRGF